MTLWLLKARDGLPEEDNPWVNPVGTNLGVVVRAKTEQRARELAQSVAADEKSVTEMDRHVIGNINTVKTYAAWTDPKYSTCEELQPDGEEAVIIIDCLDV